MKASVNGWKVNVTPEDSNERRAFIYGGYEPVEIHLSSDHDEWMRNVSDGRILITVGDSNYLVSVSEFLSALTGFNTLVEGRVDKLHLHNKPVNSWKNVMGVR